MFLKNLLFKPNLIAFYKDEEIYKVLNEQYKKEEIIFSEIKEFKKFAKSLNIDKLSFKTAQIINFKTANLFIPENKRFSRYKKNISCNWSFF